MPSLVTRNPLIRGREEGNGKGGPKAQPVGPRSALPATNAAGTLDEGANPCRSLDPCCGAEPPPNCQRSSRGYQAAPIGPPRSRQTALDTQLEWAGRGSPLSRTVGVSAAAGGSRAGYPGGEARWQRWLGAFIGRCVLGRAAGQPGELAQGLLVPGTPGGLLRADDVLEHGDAHPDLADRAQRRRSA